MTVLLKCRHPSAFTTLSISAVSLTLPPDPMSFLNSALFPALLALVGVPLLIHLLNLKFPTYFAFSSVKHLRDTIAQRSKLFRWRHLVLLALRTLFVLALLFAFLRPVLPRFGSNAKSGSSRTVLLLLDRSLSMEHLAGGVSARQRAIGDAQKILGTLGSDDSVNIILAGQTPVACFTEPAKNHGEARSFIEALKPGLGRADFSLANATAARLLTKTDARTEIYYLSDFQRKTWAAVDFTPLPAKARIFFVDAAPQPRGNHALLAASINQTQVLAGDTVTVEVEIGNFAPQPLEAPMKILIDQRMSFEKSITVPAWSSAKFTIPVPPGSPGLHLCEVTLPPDELPQDDRLCLTIPVLEKEGILIVSDAPAPDKDAALFLRTALNPYENFAGSLLPEQIRAADITPARLAAVKKIFLTHAGKLDDDAIKRLADFVFHGGGVVWFLDGEGDNASLAALEKAVPLPLRLGGKRVAKNVGTDAQQILRGDFKSKFLRLFAGTRRQNLALLEFYDIHDATPTGAGSILLTYADGTPAMAQLNHGLGTLLLMNFSAGELSSNLARQRLFPAWMQEVVKNLATDEPIAPTAIVGTTVTDEVWRSELKDGAFRKPGGSPVPFKAETLGERAALTFVPDELGFYTIQTAKLLHAYGINPPPDESDLRPIDRALLPDTLGARGQDGYFVDGREDFQDLIRGRPIFHWFLAAALALLLAESAFQLFVRRRSAETRSPS